MELPAQLRAAVDRALEGVPLADLRRAAASLSERYRAETRDGRLHLGGDLAVEAYLATRLPATYAAVCASLGHAAEVLPDFQPATLLDVGSGPGTALWAAKDCWPGIAAARLVEVSEPARRAGAALAAGMPDTNVDWTAGDAQDLALAAPADLVTLAYVLDELEPAAIARLVTRLWELTRGLLIIVEPGTPAGWRRILAARAQLIEAGAQIAAPCPHDAACPLIAPDWCHFAQRLPRSRMHRLAKDGDAPFEDEKYIFIAASRLPLANRPARVLASPRATKGRITLKLCQPDGSAAETVIAKRDGAPFAQARRLGWGDAVDL